MAEELLRWHITQGCRLLWRGWDDEFVVYNTGSADTHVLDHPSAAMLKALEGSPLTSKQLTESLRFKLDVDSKEDLSSFVSTLLQKLHELGLIESAPR